MVNTEKGMRLVMIGILLSATIILATNVSAVSCGPRRVSIGLVTIGGAEWCTFKGCDSCPPADKWLSKLSVKNDGVVPFAFHVDCRGYIGWKDPVALTDSKTRL